MKMPATLHGVTKQRLTFGSLVWAVLCVFQASPLLGQIDKPVTVADSIRTLIPRRNLKLGLSGTAYYVSLQGDDRDPGTKEKPFRHIQRFADIAHPGDVCLVRAGIYRETVCPKNGGRTGDPIRYVAYPGEEVTLNGTEPIAGSWSVYQGAIYQTKVDRDVERLFVDGKI